MADPLDLFCYLFLPLYMRVRLFLPDTIRKQSYKKVRKSLICRNARLFNGRVLAAEAFKWDLEQMLHFLDDAAKSPSRYGVHRDHHDTLAIAVGKLEQLRDPKTRRAFLKDEDRQLDPTDIDWEGVALKCHSQYEVLGLVLSILGRAPPEATRRSHHLPLLILCVKFIILVAGESPKNSAPTLVSIMFTEDDGNFKVQVACSPPERADQEVRLGESAAKDRPDLNVVMGTTILHGGKDISRKKFQKLRGLIKHVRCDILENKCGYRLPGKDVARKERWYCGMCGETFGLVVLRHNTTFKGRKVGGLSLKIKAVLEMGEIDDIKLDGLQDPCSNCQDLLRQAGVDVWRFRTSLVGEGAVAWVRSVFWAKGDTAVLRTVRREYAHGQATC